MDAILIVDDNEDVLELLPHLLTEDFGQTHRILTARSSAMAMEIAREERVSLVAVITDIGLPDVNGWELLASLRAEGLGGGQIVMSGYNKPADSSAGILVLVKPVDMPTLIRGLYTIIGPTVSP